PATSAAAGIGPGLSRGWPEPGEMYVSLASRNRIIAVLAKAAASGVVARPSPRSRADGAPTAPGATRRAMAAGSLVAPPMAQPSESMTCRLASFTALGERWPERSEVA